MRAARRCSSPQCPFNFHRSRATRPLRRESRLESTVPPGFASGHGLRSAPSRDLHRTNGRERPTPPRHEPWRRAARPHRPAAPRRSQVQVSGRRAGPHARSLLSTTPSFRTSDEGGRPLRAGSKRSYHQVRTTRTSTCRWSGAKCQSRLAVRIEPIRSIWGAPRGTAERLFRSGPPSLRGGRR